tara:strand:+ start:8780 stop:9532 length:753 start_codon:yes stop_codon:yes gene_type:complete
MNRKYFATFGAAAPGEHRKYYDAINRLKKQAENTNLFDEIIVYDDKYLKNDSIFWNKHGDFIINTYHPEFGCIGYGYWIWKSYIILKSLEQMDDNDILVYCDSGCEIDKNPDKLSNLFKLTEQYNIIYSLHGARIKDQNKMDLLMHFNMLDKNILNLHMKEAGCISIKKTLQMINFVKEWYQTCCHYSLLDDSKSINNNLNSFKIHRHDQSIFNMLLIKYDLHKIPIDIKRYIHYIRNKTGISKIGNNVL